VAAAVPSTPATSGSSIEVPVLASYR